MVTWTLVCLVLLQSIALGVMLVYCRLGRSPDEDQTESIESRDGLLGDYQSILRETLARVGIEGAGIADLGVRLSERENDIAAVLRLELTRKVGELVEANSRLRSDLAAAQERHDCLTQLPNRRAFEERVVELFGLNRRYDEDFVMVIFDVDCFKSFNDNYGHAAGDAVLAAIAKVVSERRRSTDFVARIGGEEFAILLTHTTLKQSQQCVDGYRRAIESTLLRTKERSLRVTASFGAAELLSGESTNDLKERADQALYAAKAAGRNCSRYHDGTCIVASVAGHLVAG
jgi:diguanylate cyclase (GGDEF)-like protein